MTEEDKIIQDLRRENKDLLTKVELLQSSILLLKEKNRELEKLKDIHETYLDLVFAREKEEKHDR